MAMDKMELNICSCVHIMTFYILTFIFFKHICKGLCDRDPDPPKIK